MRRPVFALAAAVVGIFFHAAPAAHADGTSPVELVPIPWTHADTGAPPLPVETEQYAISIQVYRSCWSVNLCPGDTDYSTTITLDSGATVFDQTVSGIRVRGRVVSSTAGSVWNLGIRNLRFTLPELPAVGGTLSVGDTQSYSVSVQTRSFATFHVPFDGRNATTTIVSKRSGHPLHPETWSGDNPRTWSGRLQSTGAAGPGEALTSDLLAADDITVYRAVFFGSASAYVTTESIPGNSTAVRVKSRTEDRTNTCIAGPEPADGYDCTGTLEIFTPRVIPSALATTCASDLTGDGVVNFADLAKMKSVFFKTCTP